MRRSVVRSGVVCIREPSDPRRLLCLLAGLLLCLPAAAQHDEMMPAEGMGLPLFMVSPLYGLNRNELSIPARGPAPARVLRDTEPEYGLFAMFVAPRIIANNIVFRTDPSDMKVVGDIASLNVYGPTERALTWNIGAGYLWHEIESDNVTTKIEMPLGKVGLVWRIAGLHLMVNPYVGYARERVDVETARGTVESGSDVMLYGMSAYWRWRMLQANVKYYIQDDRERNRAFDVVRGQFCAMCSRHVGVLLRAERMEQYCTTDTSFLAGPIFVF